MIQLPKQLLKQIQEGDNPQKELEQHLLSYPITDIVKEFAELLITTETYINRQPITVSEEEFEQIISLFKIKGQRTIDGMVVEERRGRPRKTVKDKD